MEDLDRAIRVAAVAAAERTELRLARNGTPAEFPLEREQFAPAVREGLRAAGLRGSHIELERRKLPCAWRHPKGDRFLGRYDVTVRREPRDEPWLAGEVKLEEVDQSLWDLFRVASAFCWDSVEAGFLVYAARPRRWKRETCTELFPPEGETHLVPSLLLFARHRLAHRAQLGRDKSRMQWVPRWLLLRGVVPGIRMDNYPHLQLHAAAVGVPRRGDKLEISGSGWPAGVAAETGAVDSALVEELRADRERLFSAWRCPLLDGSGPNGG